MAGVCLVPLRPHPVIKRAAHAEVIRLTTFTFIIAHFVHATVRLPVATSVRPGTSSTRVRNDSLPFAARHQLDLRELITADRFVMRGWF